MVKPVKPVAMNGWECVSCVWNGAEESNTSHNRLGEELL